mgnify:CR=1 FL=1
MQPSVSQALAEHAISVEVLILCEVQMKLADVQALASSECCPALRKLCLYHIRESDDEVEQKNAVPHFEAALAAVVEFHKDTLEKVSIDHHLQFGSNFFRACKSLGSQIQIIHASAAEDLDIDIIDDLYRSHPRLVPDRILARKSALWEEEWEPRMRRLQEPMLMEACQEEVNLGL